MAKEKYIKRKFKPETLELLNKVIPIIDEYRCKGYDLTLRQVYYQCVARGIFENNINNYKKLSRDLSNARLAGLLDWNAISDRTRSVCGGGGGITPAQAIDMAARFHCCNVWETQPCYLECWVEKDALIDVVRRGCRETRAAYGACRGYNSQSFIYEAAERIKRRGANKERIILYLGDLDPSGTDMTRDVQKRLDRFNAGAKVERIALSMEQVQQYNPPPCPAKETDTRVERYKQQYGDLSWELDALRPEVIEELIDTNVKRYLDLSEFASILEREEEERAELRKVADNYEAIVRSLSA